jgi:hypothetical protein
MTLKSAPILNTLLRSIYTHHRVTSASKVDRNLGAIK